METNKNLKEKISNSIDEEELEIIDDLNDLIKESDS